MGKLKQDVCVAEGDRLLFRATRGDCIVGSDCTALARVGNESFRRCSARRLYNENKKNFPARSRVTDSSGSRAELVLPLKESRKRSFPRPRGGQDAFRGKILREVRIFPPQVLRQGAGRVPPAAERVARLWAPPAPSRRASRGSAGGGFPGFADSTTWDRSAPA